MYLLPNIWTQFASIPTSRLNDSRSEVYETKGEYKINFALVGLGIDQVNIELEEDILTVKTAPNANDSIKDSQLLWSEFDSIEFERSYRLPRNVNKDEIKANMKNGLLEISLPKQKPTKQKIAIQANKAS